MTCDFPRLRHCTFVSRDSTDSILMVVGRKYFELQGLVGTTEKLMELKRYLDGRHSIHEISILTGVPEGDVQSVVDGFDNAGLLRNVVPTESVPSDVFANKIAETCQMWGRQIGYHALFKNLETGAARREVFIGLLIETYHYVSSASRHVSTAIAYSKSPLWSGLLTEYLKDEYNHGHLFARVLTNLGLANEWIATAHPIIGTQSLISLLSDIARRNTLGYIACTSLFEARAEEASSAAASLETLAKTYGFSPEDVRPAIQHMEADVRLQHVSMLKQAFPEVEQIQASLVHEVVNDLHDLKHAFDQYHDQIWQYYSEISNYIPRLKVDYFSL